MITIKEVKKTAELAKVSFIESQKKEMQVNLNKLFTFTEILIKIDKREIQHKLDLFDQDSILRDDYINKYLTQKQALGNAPSHKADIFKIPKIIKK